MGCNSAFLNGILLLHDIYPTLYLPHNGTSQGLDGADTTALRNQLAQSGLAQDLDGTGIKSNLKRLSSGETRLEGLPDLLLGVELTLRLAVPALEEYLLTGLGTLGRSDKLDGALVVVDLTFLDLGGGGEDHGGGLDTTHLDRLEVADDNDLAALHLLERDEAVETRADGAADLALVLGGVLAGGVAHGDGGDVERVGVGVVDGLQDVADTEVNEGRGRSSGGGGGLGLLGSLLLLLLLGLGVTGNSLLDLGDLLLDLLLGAVDQAGLSGLTSGNGSLLLLETLLLGLGVDGGLHVADIFLVDGDLLGGIEGEAEEGRVLDEVDVADDVRTASLAGALVGGPLGNDRSEGLVDGDVGLAGLGAEQGSAAGEVGVEGVEDRGLVLGGLETLRGGEPLLDLSLLGGSVGLGAEGHSEEGGGS